MGDSVIIDLIEDCAHPVPGLEDLLFDVLYRDFGVSRGGEWLDEMPGSALALARGTDGVLVGAVRLLASAADASRQLRQLAVKGDYRGRGIGSRLVAAVEAHAAAGGTDTIWLNARDTAFRFYERRGYAFDGPGFVSELTGIPHRRMVKRLDQR